MQMAMNTITKNFIAVIFPEKTKIIIFLPLSFGSRTNIHIQFSPHKLSPLILCQMSWKLVALLVA